MISAGVPHSKEPSAICGQPTARKCFKLDCHSKTSKAHLGYPKYKSRDNGLGPTREWSKEHSALLPPSIKRASPLEQKRLPESGGPRCEGSLSDCGGRVFSEDWSSNGASDYHGACFNFRNLPASPFATVMKWPSGMKDVSLDLSSHHRVQRFLSYPLRSGTAGCSSCEVFCRNTRECGNQKSGLYSFSPLEKNATTRRRHCDKWPHPNGVDRRVYSFGSLVPSALGGKGVGWVDNAVLFGKELPLLLDAGESVL
ncbi:uncharacterized protein CEXT_469981 [Caerostris extrusa]|uniref:Uncharacterized protein n=1 Tax=Caerostris extrusa TaxID=172846 RepID=A0AAV4NQ47_CAEEX|nr:uncharacterized protein CEXT_469981 [Caerostris extrusa]